MILVTGGSGYLGTLLMAQLAETNYHVDIADIRTPFAEAMAKLPSNRFGFRRVDVSDGDAAKTLFPKYDVIIHMAALTSVAACESDAKLAEQTNVVSTENVLRFRKPGALVLMLSTMNVYGEQPPDKPLDETCDVCPATAYAKSKAAAEFLVKGKQETVILRCAEGFGYSPNMRHDLTLHRLLNEAARGQAFSVTPKESRQAFIHARDTVGAIRFVLSHWGRMQGELYNVGNPLLHLEEKEFRRLVDCRGKEAPGAKTEPQSRFSFRKLRAKGIFPQHSFAEGVAEVLPYYEKSGPERAKG